MDKQISKKGINLIKSFEGFSPVACKCVSSEKYLTIGYGHYGADVKPGQKITRKQAEQLLIHDLSKTVAHVNSFMNIYHFNQNEFDALVSFAYNVGNIKQLTANGTRSKKVIASKILLYDKCNGVVLKGLSNRRKREKELFETPVKKKSYKAIAKEVIAGKWGNGAERIHRLVESGYDPQKVQLEVNKLLSKGGE